MIELSELADLAELAELAYMERFEEELEQISIKNSIGKHKNCNRSRQDAIRFVREGEKRDFEGPGLEFPDLTDPENFKYFQSWNGELKFVQNIKIRKFSKRELSSQEEEEMDLSANS